jgi:hypothetical protein
LFRGVTTLQKVTFAATAVLALVAGYQYYQYYVETSPAIPFAELPSQVQTEFRAKMKEGNDFWVFFENEQQPDAALGAVELYGQAYALHPRNREAVAALKKAADALLALPNLDERTRQAVAKDLQNKSAFYEKYAPVVDAVRE